jgi:hypothetical protein
MLVWLAFSPCLVFQENAKALRLDPLIDTNQKKYTTPGSTRTQGSYKLGFL